METACIRAPTYLQLLVRWVVLIVVLVVLLVLENRLRGQCEALATRRVGINDLRGRVGDNVRLSILRNQSVNLPVHKVEKNQESAPSSPSPGQSRIVGALPQCPPPSES